MRQYRKIINGRTGQTIVARARFCTGFFCRLRGLIISDSLTEDEGIIIERRDDSRFLAGVHTLGMTFEIAVIWLDRELEVVDSRYVPPWQAACIPQTAAKYIIETLPETLNRIVFGDRLIFDEVTH